MPQRHPRAQFLPVWSRPPGRSASKAPRAAAIEIITWPIERLIPYAGNPRKNDEAVDRMIASIEEFGFKIPVLALSSGEIVDGHLRVKAAQKIGMTELPILLCDEWSEAQVKAFHRLVNRSVTWAAWDEKLLAVELGELQRLNFDLTLTGFALPEINTLLAKPNWVQTPLTDEDAVPVAQEVAVSRPGDVWILGGRHRIGCGDAAQVSSVDRLMQSDRGDLVFTDPPYNVNYDGRGSVGDSWRRGPLSKRPGAKKHARPILNDNLPDPQFLEFCRGLFTSLRRCIKDGAAVYVCCSDKDMPQFRQTFEEAGFYWSATLIWSKPQFTLSRADYHPQHEPMLYGWAPGQAHHWCGKRNQGTVWSVAKPRINELHPTQKPVELIERAIENSSRAGDLVVDLCGGSGSTLIACEKTGRRARLLELDARYVDVIVERWQEFTGERASLEHDGRTFAQIKAEGTRLAA